MMAVEQMLGLKVNIMDDFEKKAYGMGLNKGMFAKDQTGRYISPVTRQLLWHYNKGELTAYLVNKLVEDLK